MINDCFVANDKVTIENHCCDNTIFCYPIHYFIFYMLFYALDTQLCWKHSSIAHYDIVSKDGLFWLDVMSYLSIVLACTNWHKANLHLWITTVNINFPPPGLPGLVCKIFVITGSLWWYHNEHNCISNHQPHHCLLNHLFRCRSKKTSKLHCRPVNSPYKGPVMWKMFAFDDVNMSGDGLLPKRHQVSPWSNDDNNVCKSLHKSPLTIFFSKGEINIYYIRKHLAMQIFRNNQSDRLIWKIK